MTNPKLVFSPLAWAHYQFLCHNGQIEASAFGITAPDDILFIESLYVPKQEGTMATTEIDGNDLGVMMEWAFDKGIDLSRIGKIWLHTHPGDSPNPSGTDEETYRKVLGEKDFAVMGILARGGATYARVFCNVGKGFSYEIAVAPAWSKLPEYLPRILEEAPKWKEEYEERVQARAWAFHQPQKNYGHFHQTSFVHNGYDWWHKANNIGVPTTPTSKSGKGVAAHTIATFNKEKSKRERKEIYRDFKLYMERVYGLNIDEMDVKDLKDGYKDFCDYMGENDPQATVLEAHASDFGGFHDYD